MLVSIILPLYNSQKYIRDTLESVCAQTYTNWELIVVDDGSPDDSGDICRSRGDERIRVFTRRNTGSCRARNFGITQARGNVIAFIDHDDIWLPRKLEAHLRHLEDDPTVGVSYCPSSFIDAEGKPLGLYQVPKLSNIDGREILCRNPIGNGSVPLIRREALEQTKFEVTRDGKQETMYFDDESMGWEDVELWFRISQQTDWRFAGIPDCLTLYRIVEDGIAGNPEKKQASFERGLKRAARYAPEFISQYGAAARAYHLRYLSRRLINSGNGPRARAYINRALGSFPGIVIEEPTRTLVTIAAAYTMSFLPKSVYGRLKATAVGLASEIQRRKLRER